MRSTTLVAIMMLAVFVAAPLAAQTDGPRHALVIGNAAYEHFGALANPANDARDMARTLRGVGFSVTELVDATFSEMDEAVFEFGETLAREGGVGLFYYAGHGVEAGGVNYLIPVEQRVRAERELAYKSIAVDRVLTEMEVARNGTNIIILDACRDNPLPAGARSAGSSRGLSVVQAPSGSLVVYATSPGQAAADGRGRNGVFTGALLNHLTTPGVDVMDMLRDVRRDVMAATGNEQTPWENSSLTTRFYFAGAPAGGVAVSNPRAAPPAAQVHTDEVAQLYIESDPMGATVTINGEERGATPAFIEAVPVGSVLEIEARDGSMTARRELQVDRADLYEVSLELEQATGNLVILTAERGLMVKLDGESAGTLESGVLRDLPAGERTLELAGEGLYYQATVTIPIDETTRVMPELQEVGTISYSLPSGSTAELAGPDGASQTVRGSGRLENQPTGEYRLTFTGLDVDAEARTIELTRAETVSVGPANGALRVASTPAGASVYVDGRYRGRTPLTVDSLEPGRREVELRLEGYQNGSFTQNIVAGRLSQRDATLEEISYSPDTVLIEGGTFRMGSASGGDDDERPVHTVRLDGFRMSSTEVTFAQYDAFARATGRDLPDDEGWGRGERPVINVSWYDAVAYANWLSEQDGLEPAYRISGTNVSWEQSASGWRLPTEAEWEYAARGGQEARDTTYAGTSSDSALDQYANIADRNTDFNWSDDSLNDGYEYTAPVGSFRANELGLYDMSGNVWEWCWDWYDSDYYEDSPANNATGPASGSYRVRRGGSWGIGATGTRVASRDGSSPGPSYYGIGFRLVLPAR